MSLRDLNIGKKLFLSFSLLCLIIIGIGGLSLTLFQRMNAETLEVTDNTVPSLMLVSDASVLISDFRRYELGYLLVINDANRQEYLNKLLELKQEASNELQKYAAYVSGADDQEAYQRVTNKWAQYLNIHNQFISTLHAGDINQAKQILLTTGSATIFELDDLIANLMKINRDYSVENRTSALSIYSMVKLNVGIALLVAIGLVILLATVLTRQIRDPLLVILDQAHQIARGDLQRGALCNFLDAGKASQDEIGQLAFAIREMKDNLSGLVSEISSSVSQLSTAVEEVSAIAEQSSHGMQQQQSEVSQLATAMNEMQSTVQEVSRNTTDAASAAQQASDASDSGSKVVQDAIGSIERVAGEIEHSGQVVQQLEQDSASISVVLDVIRNIADQTNLLALNAAIEAARAGEQGRGFAVVADEVRTLAQRTQDSTAEINKIIEVLQSRAAEAGQAMQISRQQMQTSVEQARNAGATIEQINHAVVRISDMNTQIASATEQQSSVTDELNRSIVTIHNASDEVAQGANQTAQACAELSQLAIHLQQVTNRFAV
ncbi:methyl-accepting chemotaxis protein [Plesiomonas shigelloides]|uniref:methyl-accepting chemotaxis protein n=1 Tax=Plesiomonas shigelloides TaxID=703 RepID=UPI00242A4CE6|nr:methyl-accepting chemotaxis protein [Plesiomonas shigelloides]